MTLQTMKTYISADPKICHGKACFRGTRIPVYLVLELLEGGVSPQEIVGEDYYPQLKPGHIKAALHFASSLAKNQDYIVFRP